MKEETVSVLLPFRKLDLYLISAIGSILSQTYSKLELILLDSSTAKSSDSLEFISKNFGSDSRIKLVKVESSLNLAEVLNHGISLSQGSYIARMDSDDISMKERFKIQIDFLRQNPSVSVVGSAIEIIGGMPNHKLKPGAVILAPTKEENLIYWALEKNPLFHPTALFRSELLKIFRYNPRYHLAQDYELWIRIMRKFVIDNLETPLLYYRIHSAQSGVMHGIDSKYYSTLAQVKHCIWVFCTFDNKAKILRILLKKLAKLTTLFFKRHLI